MQFVLTEEEFKNLTEKDEVLKFLGSVEELQKKCTKICNTVPVEHWGSKEFKIWGCILNEDGNGCGCGYCDLCPVQDICPCDEKGWSK